MIASWMLHALLTSVLLAGAAWLLEESCRLAGTPVRWVWLGALLGTLGLAAVAPFRVAAPAPVGPLPALEAAATVGPGTAAARPDWLAVLSSTVAEPVRTAVARADQAAGQALAAGWLALSLVLLCAGGATLLRSARARRGWPLREISGVQVRVAPATGPAVIGLRHPEVVVPEWLLCVPAEEQQLVVLHEREHVRARDPLLLTTGCVAVALTPWNPVAWWMLLRLRLAVELDCDVRVLRRGVRPRAYGSVLIDMAGRGPGLSLGVPALAGSPSNLERRLRAMTARIPRFAAVRATALGALGVATLVAACEQRMPTTPEVAAMDVAAAETQARKFEIISDNGNVTYFVDGKQVSPEEARALGGDRIAKLEMIRADAGKNARFHIVTREGKPGDMDHTVALDKEVALSPDGAKDRVVVRKIKADGTDPIRLPTEFEGLTIIDGKVAEPGALRAIRPDQIVSVEVLKGPAAAQQHSDPRAAKGVIRITTWSPSKK